MLNPADLLNLNSEAECLVFTKPPKPSVSSLDLVIVGYVFAYMARSLFNVIGKGDKTKVLFRNSFFLTNDSIKGLT